MGPAFAGSFASHAAMILMALLAIRYARHTNQAVSDAQTPHDYKIVWLGLGGGGGGGNHAKDPARRAEMPGSDRTTVPVSTPPSVEVPHRAASEPDPDGSLRIPAASLASMSELLPGAIDAPDMPPTASRGPGDGGGAGNGAGRGDGPGDGSGLGPGHRGGQGDNVYGIGGGVTPPIEIHRGMPQYTTEAMRARVQGPVLVECVVETDGSCSDIRVLRSLDPAFGLDQEAIKAARQWRFRPGTRMGTPVPVRVTIEVTFTIR
jgi:protein TonB